MQKSESFDVVVVGSGAAGLTAALAAASAGASVCVLEKAEKYGGTTAMSGGVVWTPNNAWMKQNGGEDNRAAALEYLNSLSLGRMDADLIDTFLDTAVEAVEFVAAKTALQFHALQFPDYHIDFPGARIGRSVMPDLFDGPSLGALRADLRGSASFPVPISLIDLERAGVGGLLADLDAILPSAELVKRMQDDKLASGMALAGGLLKGALDLGVVLRKKCRVQSLLVDGESIVGVTVDAPDGAVTIRANRGVVLASGGFEANPKLAKDFLRGPLEGYIGCPANEGDGLLMAMEVGAALGNMSETWWQPIAHIPGEEYEGQPFFRIVANERTMPGSIIVNKHGRRFVNEAHNYNDIVRTLHTFDPIAFDFENLPAYVITHQGRLDRAAFLTRFPTDPIPKWLVQAPTIRELAAKIGVDADTLEATVSRFNANARQGQDPDFHRGESSYDLFHGDPEREGAFQTLGPLDQAPFYALRVHSGTLGTKGGAKTNTRAEVLNVRGQVIPGLYAAGNVSASVMGMAYPGAGGTIGPAMTFGYIAGRAAAARAS